MENKVVYDIKESTLEVIIPGIAINGLAFKDKIEAKKFVEKYFSSPKVHIEDRVEKPVYSSVEEFEMAMKNKLNEYKEQLKSIKLMESKLDNETFEYDKIYLEYNIKNIERFLNKAKSNELEEERE